MRLVAVPMHMVICKLIAHNMLEQMHLKLKIMPCLRQFVFREPVIY